ncbi:dehydrogenase/reductase SDR family member on chromosome X [Monodon monoceros]|uniref:dehydrogenase/reductase SDR family member on chromosome X n=1 Tax=Monodon monoceros TaxID=40151 RepID=UPI0010F4353B|nr:dehydrogenase/reductase SDR family member on chromosome X [Monodon monoceros]
MYVWDPPSSHPAAHALHVAVPDLDFITKVESQGDAVLDSTPDEGAWTSVYAAVTPALEGRGGCYLYNEKETKSLAVTYDLKLQRQLWARSCQMTGITDVTQEVL